MLHLNIFYHDSERLRPVVPRLARLSRCKIDLLDLNRLEIPEDIRSERFNAARQRYMLSEYLGLITIRPKAGLVGAFVYSIPLKFSAAYAEKTANPIFLPPLNFEQIAKGAYRPEKIYAAEFSNPFTGFESYIETLHNEPALRAGEKPLTVMGPFKGSFIVNAERFGQYQRWMKRVIRFFIDRIQREEIFRIGRAFDLPQFKDPEILRERMNEKDYYYRGFGHIIERATAYYLGQLYDEHDKVRLGPYLAASSRKGPAPPFWEKLGSKLKNALKP